MNVSQKFRTLVLNAEMVMAKMLNGPIRQSDLDQVSDYLFEARQLEQDVNDINLSKRWQIADLTHGQLCQAYGKSSYTMMNMDKVHTKEEFQDALPKDVTLDELIGSDVSLFFRDDGYNRRLKGKLHSVKDMTLSIARRENGELSMEIIDFMRISQLGMRMASFKSTTKHRITL